MAGLSKTSRIGFVGSGMVGKSLALALSRKGYAVVSAASRTFSSARALAGLVSGAIAYPTAGEAAEAADVVFITTPDDAIGPVTSSISWRRGQGVVHTSGAASLDVLESAERQGAAVGALHPLQTFSSVDEAARNISGSTFAIEGQGEMRAFLNRMALDLGGRPIFLRPEDKPLYHASVVMMGGLLTGLAGSVADAWRHFGIDRDEAVKALAPIIRGDAATLESVGIPGALAGPYVRGDLGTIRKHLDALRSLEPEMLATYCQMALATLPYALQKGNVPEETAARMREMLASAHSDARPRDRE